MRKPLLFTLAAAAVLSACAPKNEVAEGTAPDSAKVEPAKAGPNATAVSPKAPSQGSPPTTRPDSAAAAVRGGTGDVNRQGILWKPAPAPARDLAQRIDQAVGGLKDTKAHVEFVMQLPTGTANGHNDVKIKDAKTFSIHYPALNNGVPFTALAKSDGKRVAELVRLPDGDATTGTLEEMGYKVRPVTKITPAASAESLVEVWPTGFNRNVFAAYIDGSKPFSELVSALESGAGGFKVMVDQRDLPSETGVRRNYRLVAERTPEAAKKLGTARIEVIVEAATYLPTVINTEKQAPGESAPTKMSWMASWERATDLKPADFKLPGG